MAVLHTPNLWKQLSDPKRPLEGSSFVAPIIVESTVSLKSGHGTYYIGQILGTTLVVPILLRQKPSNVPKFGRWTWVKPTTAGWFWTIQLDREISNADFLEGLRVNPAWLDPLAEAVRATSSPAFACTAAAAAQSKTLECFP